MRHALAAALILLGVSTGSPVFADDEYFTDQRSGCRIWAMGQYSSSRDATVQWSGACSGGMAAGPGLVTFKYTTPKQTPHFTSMEGTFAGGKLNGRGLVLAVYNGSPSRLEGIFVDGKMNGHGKIVSGTSYREGEWRDGLLKGYGQEIISKDCNCKKAGWHYVGEWKDSMYDGKGVLTTGTGEKYEGEWVQDAPEGRLTLTRSDGSRYVGKWYLGCSYGPDDKLHVFPGPNGCAKLTRGAFDLVTRDR